MSTLEGLCKGRDSPTTHISGAAESKSKRAGSNALDTAPDFVRTRRIDGVPQFAGSGIVSSTSGQAQLWNNSKLPMQLTSGDTIEVLGHEVLDRGKDTLAWE